MFYHLVLFFTKFNCQAYTQYSAYYKRNGIQKSNVGRSAITRMLNTINHTTISIGNNISHYVLFFQTKHPIRKIFFTLRTRLNSSYFNRRPILTLTVVFFKIENSPVKIANPNKNFTLISNRPTGKFCLFKIQP